jgi:hypothetical protein
MQAIDGTFNSVTEAVTASIDASTWTNGIHFVFVRGRDAAGNWGTTTSTAVRVDRTGPLTSAASVAPNPSNGATSVTLSANATDASTGGSNIAGAEWFEGADPGAGLGRVMTATDGTFNSPTEGIRATVDIRLMAAGNHTVSLRSRDAAGNWGATASATFTVSDSIFADGFESGNFSAWSSTSGGANLSVTPGAALVGTRGMQSTVNGSTPTWAQDDHPVNESAYRARFRFDPNGTGTATSQHDIFVARTTTGVAAVRVQYRRTTAAPILYQVRAIARRSNGTEAATSWFTITDAPHSIEVAWRAATNSSFSLFVDGALKQQLSNLDTNAFRIDSARLGPSTGLSAGMSGVEFFDAFVSTRTTPIGP